jgi:metal-responsive CopG/Arc/MetJ family transcriptional regulator
MPAQKVAITVPLVFLKKLDSWAKKTGKSRSRFIVEEMNARLIELEDKEITKLYNHVYSDMESSAKCKELAEEMLEISGVDEMENKW